MEYSRNPRENLVNKIKLLKKEDKKAFEIVKNARKFSRDNLAPANIFCYHLLVFKELSERIVSPIEVEEGMEEVERKTVKCDCSDEF